MQSELKPCPYCGSDHICPSSWDIQCQDCKAMMPGEPEDASSRWNRRSLTAALSDQERAVEEGARVLAKWIGYAWDGLSERDISAEYPDWVGHSSLNMQGGKPALRKVAAAILSLAATRSGSATGQKGCGE